MLLKNILVLVSLLLLGARSSSESTAKVTHDAKGWHNENPLDVHLTTKQPGPGPFPAPDLSYTPETPAPETPIPAPVTPTPDRPSQTQEDGNRSRGTTVEESWTMWLAAFPQPGILLGTLGLQFSSIFNFFFILLDFLGFFVLFNVLVRWLETNMIGTWLITQATWVKSRYDDAVARCDLPSKAVLKEVIREHLANNPGLVEDALRAAAAEHVANNPGPVEAALRADTEALNHDGDVENPGAQGGGNNGEPKKSI